MDNPEIRHIAREEPARITIRDATDDDLPSMVAMLNHEIAASPHVYAESPVSVDERRGWLASHRAAGLPVIVAVERGRSGEILGWAALSPYRASSGYRFTAELSVYVDPLVHRRGIGSQLIARLHDAARSRGLHALVGSVDADNAASIALLERFGFVEAARLPEVGWKFGCWRTQLLVLHVLDPDVEDAPR